MRAEPAGEPRYSRSRLREILIAQFDGVMSSYLGDHTPEGEIRAQYRKGLADAYDHAIRLINARE